MAQRTIKVKSAVVGQLLTAYVWTHPMKTAFQVEVLSNSIAGRKMKDATPDDSVVVRNISTNKVLKLTFSGGGAHTEYATYEINEEKKQIIRTLQELRVTFKIEAPDAVVAAEEAAVAAPEEPAQRAEECVAS